jgi:tetratricopeptide (TPR) repeat protein
MLGYEPESAPDWNNQGWSRLLAGRYEAALQDFAEAIKIDSTYKKARINRAHTYSKLGKKQEALADIDYLFTLDADSFEGLENKCQLYQDWHQFSEAVKWCDKAVTRYPEEAVAYSTRGFEHLEAGEYEPAISDFQMAIELNPSQEDAISNLDRALNEVGDDALSRGVYEHLRKVTGAARWDDNNRLAAKAAYQAGISNSPEMLMQELFEKSLSEKRRK